MPKIHRQSVTFAASAHDVYKALVDVHIKKGWIDHYWTMKAMLG